MSIEQVYFTPTPKPVGFWQLPGGTERLNMRLSAYKQPRRTTIFMMRLIFEIEWIPA